MPKPGQTHEPEGLVEVREWIAAALASSGFVLEAQPPAQPHSRVVVERPIRRSDGAYREVVRPSAKGAVQLTHQLCGFFKRQFGQPPLDPIGLDVREILAVYSRRAPCLRRGKLVGAALGIGMRQNVVAADRVVQGLEAIANFCLRFRV